ncbi:MAG: YfcE family phosphodiesterase [Treponema sp.]|nr:YfcE family phosphodiesterase [Treponema sp.]
MSGKKLLAFSDTHGNIPALKAVMNWAKDRLPPNDTICCAAFMGDGISDLRPAADATGFYCDWNLVSGNNDYRASVPEAAVFDFCENRFFICHGHRHSLYGGYHSLTAAARNSQANVVLYGHTHVPSYNNIDGLLVINPGSVGRPRSRIGASFAVIECAPNEPLSVQFWGIGDRGQIRKLKI